MIGAQPIPLALCDLCSDVGIRTAAVADVPVPGTGGAWASVCSAHRYRIDSEARINTRLLLSAVQAPADREVAS